MHIKVNKENKIEHMHAEKWDRAAFPADMVDKLMTFKDAPVKSFINFSFTEKLFLYTQILYILKEESAPLYLWCNSVMYGDDYSKAIDDHAMMGSAVGAKYAIFSCKADELKPNSYMITQDQLMKEAFDRFGAKTELIELSSGLDVKEMFKLFGLFNLVRNCQNEVRFFEEFGDKMGELYTTSASTKAYIVALGLDGSLRAFTTSDLLQTPREYLKTFQSFYFVKPENETQEMILNQCRELVQSIYNEVVTERKK